MGVVVLLMLRVQDGNGIPRAPIGQQVQLRACGYLRVPRSSGFVTVATGNQHQVRISQSDRDVFSRLLCLTLMYLCIFQVN